MHLVKSLDRFLWDFMIFHLINLPHEFKEILAEKFPSYDIDALPLAVVEQIKNVGTSRWLQDNGLRLKTDVYAKLSQQFNASANGTTCVRSIHKLKGLEDETVYFIICNSLLEILLGLKNDYNRETNLLYVALTRTKFNLLFIIEDDDTTTKSFEKHGVDIAKALQALNIPPANKSDWF